MLQKKGEGEGKEGGDSLLQLLVAEGQRKFALKLMAFTALGLTVTL